MDSIRFIQVEEFKHEMCSLKRSQKGTYVTNAILPNCYGLGNTGRITTSEVEVLGAGGGRLLSLSIGNFFYFVSGGSRIVAGDVHRNDLGGNVCDFRWIHSLLYLYIETSSRSGLRLIFVGVLVIELRNPLLDKILEEQKNNNEKVDGSGERSGIPPKGRRGEKSMSNISQQIKICDNVPRNDRVRPQQS